MNTAKPVSLNVTNAELNDALEICFKNQPLNFKIEDKVVVIQAKTPSFPPSSRTIGEIFLLTFVVGYWMRQVIHL